MRNNKSTVKLLLTLLLIACAATTVVADSFLADPMTIGVGARALGMGKAYVAVAEDGDALFMNPAGLAQITAPKLSTMYTSLMGDVDYMVVGGAMPYGERGAIGAGIVNSRVGEIPLTNTVGKTIGTGSWGNSVVFLSYGTYLNRFGGLRLGRDVLVGGSLKYFTVGGSGTGVEEAAGSGISADLGLLVPATDAITLGLNLQNALPGKITKTSGVEDKIPVNLKVGTKVALIGPENALNIHSSRKLFANVDYDQPVSGNGEGALHLGAEFWPVNNFALRVGSDKNNLTAGAGIRLSGVEFNYAYHPYNGISEDTTHYFSVSYLGEPRKRELRIKINTPVDKSVIYEDVVTVSGLVEVIEGDDVTPLGSLTVKANGALIPINADRTFSAEIPIERYGKKLVEIEATDAAGTVAKEDVRLIRLVSFADVPDGYWAKMPIENNATVGLVQGYPDGNFKPGNALSRAELATLLVRAKGIKVEGQARQIFKDVKPDFWAAKYIELAVREGLVKGYPDGSFRPNNKISRVEGIAVLARFDNLRLTQVDARPFWDLPTSHWGAKYVQAAKDAGMLKFVEQNRLNPKTSMVRSEAVEMLGLTSLASGKIKDLYTWEKGFKRERERPQTVGMIIY